MRMLLAAAAIVLVHLVMRALGLGTHASVIAGMPISDVSYVIGPLYVVVRLAAFVIAPIFAIAAALSLLRHLYLERLAGWARIRRGSRARLRQRELVAAADER